MHPILRWEFDETDSTNKKVLLEALRNADPYYQYCSVEIANTDFPEEELIINPRDNFIGKADYYEKAYTNELILKNCDKIRISSFQLTESIEEVG